MSPVRYSTTPAAPTSPLRVSVVSAETGRRLELRLRLYGDSRLSVAGLPNQSAADFDAADVVILDVAGGEHHAIELIERLARPEPPTILAVVADEDDVEFARSIIIAGAAGVSSLRQPASSMCQAVVDVAAGIASVSPAIEAALVRQLQALPAD